MDWNIDDSIYFSFYQALPDEVAFAPQKKIFLTRMLKLSVPDQADYTYRNLGEELENSGQLQKSLLAFKKASIINPYNTQWHNNLIGILFKLEKENEAFHAMKKALSKNTESSTFHKLLVQNLEKKHRLEELETFLKETADMIEEPDCIPNFYCASAEALVRDGKFSQALSVYRKILLHNPPSMRYDQLYHYGLALYNEGLFEEAIVQFEQVKILKPSVQQAWNSIAHTNYCLGRVQKAREEFEYIIENGFQANLTYSNFLLVLHHLDEDEVLINKYKDLLEQSIPSYGSTLLDLYDNEMKLTQKITLRDDIDEKTREFNIKKLEGINFVVSFIKEKKSLN